MSQPLTSLRIVILLFLSLCLARAQDFLGAGISAQTAGRAGIYVPDSGNALDALSLTPAGLASLRAPVLNVSVLGSMARGTFTNSTNQSSPMSLTAGAIPYGAVATPLGNRWTIAAGFMPDLLSLVNWRFNDAPGVAGANYGAQREKSQILGFRSTAGVSYTISSRVSVGVSASAIYNANTLIMPYVFQSNPSLKGLKTLLDLHTSGIGWATSAGIILVPSRRWEIGASFRSKSAITSSGTATGNMGAQFTALGIPFRPDFAYQAQVRVEIPQAALVSFSWQQNPGLRFSFQSGWTNWNRGFANLPVSLTNGNNSDINRFLGSSTIKDVIPLNWKDQVSFHGAVDRKVAENVSVSAGYQHQNSPVPASTLSPLTAAIMSNALTAGVGYRAGLARFDLAYQFNLTAQQTTGTSALLSGEFANSRVRVGTQALILSMVFLHF